MAEQSKSDRGGLMPVRPRFGRPEITFESKPFFDAAADGKFLIKRCRACGEPHWYPRVICPFCFSEDTAWEEASGEGEIYAFSVTYFGGDPFAIGYVTLKEGPAALTNFVDCELEALRIGQKVKVKFVPSEGGVSIPVFAPA